MAIESEAARSRERRGSGGFPLRDLLIGAAGLAGDADEEALVDEAIGDGGGGRSVRSLKRRLVVTAAVEDLVKEIRAASVEAQVAQFVDEQEIWRTPTQTPTQTPTDASTIADADADAHANAQAYTDPKPTVIPKPTNAEVTIGGGLSTYRRRAVTATSDE